MSTLTFLHFMPMRLLLGCRFPPRDSFGPSGIKALTACSQLLLCHHFQLEFPTLPLFWIKIDKYIWKWNRLFPLAFWLALNSHPVSRHDKCINSWFMAPVCLHLLCFFHLCLWEKISHSCPYPPSHLWKHFVSSSLNIGDLISYFCWSYKAEFLIFKNSFNPFL